MLTYEVVQDDSSENPRELDNLGTMCCFHKRYILGDKNEINLGAFTGWAGLAFHLKKEWDAVLMLPLYMLDHSGLSISTRPFGCPWDSGQVGYIYATKKAVVATFGDSSSKTLKKVRDMLEQEVVAYNQYLQGDVWGIIIENEKGEEVDSCWGFYGHEYAETAAQERCAELEKERQVYVDISKAHMLSDKNTFGQFILAGVFLPEVGQKLYLVVPPELQALTLVQLAEYTAVRLLSHEHMTKKYFNAINELLAHFGLHMQCSKYTLSRDQIEAVCAYGEDFMMDAAGATVSKTQQERAQFFLAGMASAFDTTPQQLVETARAFRKTLRSDDTVKDVKKED